MHNRCEKNTGLRQSRFCCLLILGTLLGPSTTVWAQQPFAPAVRETVLPDAPGEQAGTSQSLSSKSTGRISGTVLDMNEGIVAGAKITLEPQSGLAQRVAVADGAGAFAFDDLPAGTFKVRITAPGFVAFEFHEITLHAGENYQLAKAALAIAAIKADVTVVATADEIAQEQVHDETQQRVLGFFPNFYTSYLWDAAPLNPKQKFHLAIRAATDPVTFFTTGMLAGIQQADNSYAGYGQGAQGYAKRYGADFADLFIGRMFGSAIFPTIFHQDPRYFYQGSGSFKSRAWHALSSAFVCRGDNGKQEFNYSHILGNLTAGGISNFYRPDDQRGVALVFENALLHTAANSTGNLVREFGLRQITTKVPSYGKGKQQPVVVSPKP
jgi:hypothetical protein